jgi:sugar lactone lactonase YvrE
MRQSSYLLLSASLLTACAGSDGSSTTPPGSDGGTDSGGCVAGGTGSITVTISGLPTGVNAKVSVKGTSTQTVTATQTIGSAASGEYTVTAEKVIAPDPIVRTVYVATVATGSFCLADKGTQSVTVTYAAVPASNKLWVTNGGPDSAAPLEGFSSMSLAMAGSPPATVAAKTGGSGQLAFDKDGNLWAKGSTTADPPLLRLAVGDLGASGSKTADRKIQLPALKCIPAVGAIAIDTNENLWFTSPCDKKVFKISAAQLAASGDVTPAVSMATTDGTQGLAFDKSGNLWVSDAEKLYRFDAASLASGGAPARTITVKTKADATGTVLHPGWLLFDTKGDLWSSDFGGNVIFRIPASDLSGSASEVVPPVQITLGVTALLEGMAFDEGGGLWVTFTSRKIARLTPTQLTMSSGPGSPTMPDRIISSPDMGSADGLVFYPAPAGLPLASSLP